MEGYIVRVPVSPVFNDFGLKWTGKGRQIRSKSGSELYKVLEEPKKHRSAATPLQTWNINHYK